MKAVGGVRGDVPRLGNLIVPYSKIGAMQRRGSLHVGGEEWEGSLYGHSTGDVGIKDAGKGV